MARCKNSVTSSPKMLRVSFLLTPLKSRSCPRRPVMYVLDNNGGPTIIKDGVSVDQRNRTERASRRIWAHRCVKEVAFSDV